MLLRRLTPISKLLYSIAGGLIYSFAVMTACSQCKQTSNVLRILKCVSCFKPVCEKCAVGRYAQKFCSQDCAKSFFLDENGELGTES
jgi:hypothetical protein